MLFIGPHKTNKKLKFLYRMISSEVMAIQVLHTEDTKYLNVCPVTYHVSPITYHLSPLTPPLYKVGRVIKTKPPIKPKQIRTQTTVFKKN